MAAGVYRVAVREFDIYICIRFDILLDNLLVKIIDKLIIYIDAFAGVSVAINDSPGVTFTYSIAAGCLQQCL